MSQSPPNLADALMRFARPLIECMPRTPQPELLQPALAIAAKVWNSVALQRRGRPSGFMHEAVELTRKQFRGPDLPEVIHVLQAMEATKLRERRPDLRLINSVELHQPARGRLTYKVVEGELSNDVLATDRHKNMPQEARDSIGASDLVWLDLYRAASALKALAPWRWMGDEQRFGVADPVTGRIDWCCVMGSEGTFPGLAVYFGDEGYAQLEEIIDADAPPDVALFGLDAIVLGFVDRKLVSPTEHTRLKRLGFSFRGKAAWPQLDRHAVNCIPVLAGDADALRMTQVLEQALHLAARAAQKPALVLPDLEGRRVVRVARPVEGGLDWRDERQTTPARREAPVPQFDNVRAERVRTSLRRSAMQIECDVFPGPMLIEDRDKAAYKPAMFMVVEGRGGAIAHMDMHEPAGREAWAQVQLIASVEKLGCMPAALFVKRVRLELVLAPVAQALGMRVERVGDLIQLDNARAQLTRYTRDKR